MKKKKWLLVSSYNPHKSMIEIHLNSISKQLDVLYKRYEIFLKIGDLNSEISEEALCEFCCVYGLKNLVKSPTCFKNIDHPSCIDLILTNKSGSFQNTLVIETGLSDFDQLTVTVMKMNFQKQVPKILYYRNMKHFDNEIFRNDFYQELSKYDALNIECIHFEEIFLKTFNVHAPLKKRFLRANNSPFMNKQLCEAIMERYRLRNKYLKLKTNDSKNAYKKQRNYCVGLFKKVKKQFYENLDVNFVYDNKKFWKQINPFFSDKSQSYNNITLVENNEIISDPVKCAEIMNNFFSDSVMELNIDRELHTNVTDATDPVTRSVEKYKNHPSIIKLNSEDFSNSSFAFQPISESSTLKVILDMDSSKTYQKDNIPPKLLKANGDICSIIITPDVNRCIANGKFPINLKNADITPIFKKSDRLLKMNYRPVSILPTVSKVYEKILYAQIYEHFNKIFSKFLCGFRKGHSIQHCLLFMLEKLNKALDKGLHTGILLTDLSKAFDSISHDLFIAKLNSYGFSKMSLNLLCDYLSGRKQRTKIGDNFSSYREIIYGVPQGSILGPLLFNIYINDLFLFSKDFNVANYADDCSPFEFRGTIDNFIKN